jgi:Fe-S cluster assembly scaffold protein SufB
VKQDPDWVREFRHKALAVFESKPTPTNWATKDLENIHFDDIRYYLSDGEKPKRSWDEVPEEVLKKHNLSYDERTLQVCLKIEDQQKVAQWDDQGNLIG